MNDEHMRHYRFRPPPAALRRPGVRLDNVAIVPANLLPYKQEWQALANGLPRGATLIVLPASRQGARRTLETVAARMKARGRAVTTLPASRFGTE